MKQDIVPKKRRPAALAARLLLTLLLLLALAGCAAPAASVPGTPQNSVPGAAPAADEADALPAVPGGTLPQSSDVFIVDAMPKNAAFTVGTPGGSVFIWNGEPVGSSAAGDRDWLLDSAGREEPLWIRKTANEQDGTMTYALYTLDGRLLLDCGEHYPAGRLGSRVFLNALSGSYTCDLSTGEVFPEGYLIAVQPAEEGYYLLSGTYDTDNPPLLLNQELEVVRRFEGYDNAYTYQGGGYDLPGYIVLSRNDEPKSFLYSLVRDEILPGEFIAIVDGGQPMAIFSTGEGWILRDLATDEPVEMPDTGDYRRIYTVFTPQVKIYTLDGDLTPGLRYYLEYPGGVVSCVDAGPLPNGWYAEKPDGSVLMIGREGEVLGTLESQPNAMFWGSVGMHPGLRLRVYDTGGELFNRDGLLLQSEKEQLYLEQLSADRYAFSWTENGRFITNLLDADGGVILAGLDSISATGTPGVWAAHRGEEHGLMNENGDWLWSMDVSP